MIFMERRTQEKIEFQIVIKATSHDVLDTGRIDAITTYKITKIVRAL